MKIIKILLNTLAILVGAIMTLYALISLLESFNALLEANGAWEVGFGIGYMVVTISLGCLFVWIFLRGLTFFYKKREVTKEEVEKMINDLDK